MHISVDRLGQRIAALPWRTPLADWPEDLLVGLPRGISRHIVRFVRIDGAVLAIKETRDERAERERDMLQALHNLEVPAVVPVGCVTERCTEAGELLPGALLTAHLRHSLPYRELYSQRLTSGLADRLADALAALLVRLHLAGFFWGDVSLSNTLFRRDADSFAAYLVDAETGELHADLSDGQREHDLQLARTNIAGDFLDLRSGGHVEPDVDLLAVSTRLLERYRALWSELTGSEEFRIDERWRIDARVRRLNDLGFDLGELTITTDLDGVTTRIEPKVVEPGHHRRRLQRLTGLRAEENQARRMLNDLDSFRMSFSGDDGGAGGEEAVADEEAVAGEAVVAGEEERAARRWLAEVYLPVVEAVPLELRDRLAPPQVFHEFLDHRWFLSEHSGTDVPTSDAVHSYVRDVLAFYRDERSLVGEGVGPDAPGPQGGESTPASREQVDDRHEAPARDKTESHHPAEEQPSITRRESQPKDRTT